MGIFYSYRTQSLLATAVFPPPGEHRQVASCSLAAGRETAAVSSRDDSLSGGLAGACVGTGNNQGIVQVGADSGLLPCVLIKIIRHSAKFSRRISTLPPGLRRPSKRIRRAVMVLLHRFENYSGPRPLSERVARGPARYGRGVRVQCPQAPHTTIPVSLESGCA